ncbi:Hydroxypyruvate isomerase [Gaiella occulta]|uniref:Hydroxypyruvate isomerase n=2 Tax=Gaiella occulta TaxID=1002870 RepID=A0A7M2YTN5_9ACTN|nr:Hydroxypyruvate isomerase [Gaiella occulta]
MPAGDRGLLNDPARRQEFRDNVPVALELARRIGCTRLNALVGVEVPDLGRAEQLELARENVAWAADQAAAIGADVLIEAINTIENGPYLLSRTDAAADFARSVGRANVRLLYDVYHMQRMEGNLAATIAEHLPDIAHIQIADSPGRGEPGTGEIDFGFLLARIEELGYDGWVGLEYRPSHGSTEESLDWLPLEGRGAARADGRP